MPHVTHYRDCRGGERPVGWVDEEWNHEFVHYVPAVGGRQTKGDTPSGGPHTITYRGHASFANGHHGPIEDVAWFWYTLKHDIQRNSDVASLEDILSAVLAYVIHHDLPGDIELLCEYVRNRYRERHGREHVRESA